MRAGELISSDTRFFNAGRLTLESGQVLPSVRVAYRTWGRLAPTRDNAVLVCHALTGSADVDRWWPQLLGPGKALDSESDFVISSNVLGSCYGTTGPASPRRDGALWGPDFPEVTIRDMVRVQARLLDGLGVRRLRLVIGGSLGGMQALEWAVSHPERLDAVAAIATSAKHSPWCIGLSEAQRAAIRADAAWREGRYPKDDPPRAGLAAARMVAMCSYRSPEGLEKRFGRRRKSETCFDVEGWLRYHGRGIVDRFDANSYITLTAAMDRHDVGQGRGGVRAALSTFHGPALVVTIDSDALYPPAEQISIAEGLPSADLFWLHSAHGHDAFLIEGRCLNGRVRSFRNSLAGRLSRIAC
jgi:homoserine O-acetyltransferase